MAKYNYIIHGLGLESETPPYFMYFIALWTHCYFNLFTLISFEVNRWVQKIPTTS